MLNSKDDAPLSKSSMHDARLQLARAIAAEAAQRPRSSQADIVTKALAEVERSLIVLMTREFQATVMRALEAAVWKALMGLCRSAEP